jgi:threonylcarbamoyladenosine tRNA methylthiotransferase MtaB
MKVAITTLGCKANQFDSDVMTGLMKEENLDVVSFKESADAYIINTCTVTGKTDYQSRQLVRKARQLNPSATLIVTGCYAQVASHELTKIEGIDYILGNCEKDSILTFLQKDDKRDSPVVSVRNIAKERALSYGKAVVSPSRTKAYLKIQDGCNAFCTFCIIPKARGRSRSLSPKRIFEEMAYLMNKGFREVILTGIDLGSYGADLSPSISLTNLLKETEDKEYPCRIRLSSLEPKEITDDLIDLMGGSSSLCYHVHISLQSGDDQILSRMNRHYSSYDFERVVKKLTNTIPNIGIGVDVIAGFPGEEEKNFTNTYQLLKNLPLSYFHVFPFSKRRGTRAAEFPHQVEQKIIKKRAHALRVLGEEKKRTFYRKNKGRTEKILVETTSTDKGVLRGFTRNYIPLSIRGDVSLKGKELPVTLGDFSKSEKRVTGKLVQ